MNFIEENKGKSSALSNLSKLFSIIFKILGIILLFLVIWFLALVAKLSGGDGGVFFFLLYIIGMLLALFVVGFHPSHI
ncbi:MAG: hypothetical protein ACKOAD_04335 [Gammaproteobacteria bacterium]